MLKSKAIELAQKLQNCVENYRTLGNAGAAANYAEKVARICEKYNISQEQLKGHHERRDSFAAERLFESDSEYFRPQTVDWQNLLFDLICSFFGCSALVGRENNLKTVVGYAAGRLRVKETYLHLFKSAEAEFLKYSASRDEDDAELRRFIETSFYFGFNFGINKRLSEFVDAQFQLSEIQQSLVKSQGLVRADGLAKSAQELEFEKIISKADKMPVPTPVEVEDEAFYAGMRCGDTVAFNDRLGLDFENLNEQIARHNQLMENECVWTQAVNPDDYGVFEAEVEEVLKSSRSQDAARRSIIEETPQWTQPSLF